MPRIGSFVQGIYRDESRTIGEIVAAVCAAQDEFAPVILDETGYRGGQAYKYASIHAIRRATGKALSKHRLLLNHVYGRNDEGECVTTVLRHVSGEYMASTSLVPDRDDVQDSKAVKTLLCRTHIEGLLGIVTEQDDDGQSQSSEKDQKRDAEWANAFSLAKTAILSARDLATVDRHLATVQSRIHEGRMAPGALQEIEELCAQRKKELSPKKETASVKPARPVGDEGTDASGSGSGSTNGNAGRRAVAT